MSRAKLNKIAIRQPKVKRATNLLKRAGYSLTKFIFIEHPRSELFLSAYGNKPPLRWFCHCVVFGNGTSQTDVDVRDDVLFANTQIACRAASYFRFPVIHTRPLLRDINESLAALRKLALGCWSASGQDRDASLRSFATRRIYIGASCNRLDTSVAGNSRRYTQARARACFRRLH